MLRYSTDNVSSFTTLYGKVKDGNPLSLTPQFLQESSFVVEESEELTMNNVNVYGGRIEYFQVAIAGKESSWFSQGSSHTRRYDENSTIQLNAYRTGDFEDEKLTVQIRLTSEKYTKGKLTAGIFNYKKQLFSQPIVDLVSNNYEAYTDESLLLPIDRQNFIANGIYINVVPELKLAKTPKKMLQASGVETPDEELQVLQSNEVKISYPVTIPKPKMQIVTGSGVIFLLENEAKTATSFWHYTCAEVFQSVI